MGIQVFFIFYFYYYSFFNLFFFFSWRWWCTVASLLKRFRLLCWSSPPTHVSEDRGKTCDDIPTVVSFLFSSCFQNEQDVVPFLPNTIENGLTCKRWIMSGRLTGSRCPVLVASSLLGTSARTLMGSLLRLCYRATHGPSRIVCVWVSIALPKDVWMMPFLWAVEKMEKRAEHGIFTWEFLINNSTTRLVNWRFSHQSDECRVAKYRCPKCTSALRDISLCHVGCLNVEVDLEDGQDRFIYHALSHVLLHRNWTLWKWNCGLTDPVATKELASPKLRLRSTKRLFSIR